MEFEEKFLVINWKHLKAMPYTLFERMADLLEAMQPHLPDNKYYVCNQDEPYAQDVLDVISRGEDEKGANSGNNN